MNDCISRQAAIDEIDSLYFDTVDDHDRTKERIKRLQSAQPEIIQCKDCKYSEEDDEMLLCHYYGDQWNESGHWCSHAERRTDCE